MSSGYYNLDAILAEEELVPCTTNFDFSYLSHLDPDRSDDGNHYLPENTKIKMPVWSISKWADLGFCKISSLPRHYGRKARELLDADAKSVDLRKRNERFFLSGKAIITLIERSAHKTARNLRGRGHNAQLQQLENILQEAAKLRETLLQVRTALRIVHGWQRVILFYVL